MTDEPRGALDVSALRGALRDSGPAWGSKQGGSGQVADLVSSDPLASICHDLAQHIAIGLLLSEPPGGEEVSAETRHRFEVMHRQFEELATLTGLLSGHTEVADGFCA